MTHQTGIGGDASLYDCFAKAKGGDIRLLKIGIVSEQLTLMSSSPPRGSWQQDYDSSVLPCLDDSMPCYILYKLDNGERDQGSDWLFICYTPEGSPVRQKMLYAATRMALKNEFGPACIRDELFGTVPSDVDYNGYMQHLSAQSAPKPLTTAEKELELIRQNEAEMSRQPQRQTVRSVKFPLSSEAINMLLQLKDRKINYVQLSLDSANEVINPEIGETVDVPELSSKMPLDHARYHFYHYSHVFRGMQMNTLVFIYSMPGYKCPIKERMLYSTCKSPLLELAKEMGLNVVRSIETDDPTEVTNEFLHDQVHP